VNFLRPLFLWLCLLAPLGLFISLRRRAGLEAALSRLCGPRRRAAALASWRRAAALGEAAAFLGWLALAFALAGSSWDSRVSSFRRTGLELCLVIDVSRSMDARDVEPSRLLAARDTARRLIEAAPGAYYSLVIAKGGASLLVPMTEDRDSLIAALDYAEAASISSPGTDLGAGLEEADRSFSALEGAERRVILLSDGGDLSGKALRQAAALAAKGRRLSVIGLGLAKPVTVPGADGKPLVDERGLPVLVPREDGLLRALARAGAGTWIPAEEGKLLGEFLDSLGSLGKGGSYREYERRDRTPFFALLCFLAFSFRILAELFALSFRPPAADEAGKESP
jgi:Ca-activated chloride channel family protein